MDGFMDTMDAVHSYGDRTKKLEILKDPHLGAFAVICAAVYLLLYTGSMYEFCKNAQGKAIFYPVLFLSSERVFSGLSVIMLPSAKNNQENLLPYSAFTMSSADSSVRSPSLIQPILRKTRPNA